MPECVGLHIQLAEIQESLSEIEKLQTFTLQGLALLAQAFIEEDVEVEIKVDFGDKS